MRVATCSRAARGAGGGILQITEDGTIEPVGFDDALPVRTLCRFPAGPAAAVRALLDSTGSGDDG